jgi:predicted ATP-dependent endonuclease of OLD family
MKTFRGFSLKPNVGLGLQTHFQRKNTQEPARYSKWGSFKDLDWDFLDREFYSKGGKKRTEGQNDEEEMVQEEKVKVLGKAICFSDRNRKRNSTRILIEKANDSTLERVIRYKSSLDSTFILCYVMHNCKENFGWLHLILCYGL